MSAFVIGGCALAAWPAEPGESGIMSFLVGPDGKVLDKDLGDATTETMEAMLEYDPDDTWELADAPGS